MSLSKILYPLLSTGSTQEDKKLLDMTEKLLTGTKSINTNLIYFAFLIYATSFCGPVKVNP